IVAHIAVEAKPALTEDVRELAQDIGEDIDEEVAEGKTTLVGRVGARSKLGIGDAAELAVDTGALHFFDPETGSGIYDEEPTKGAS
ncbi:MAG: ABC transporter ATP-binding protein, partial [Gaiellaceae bacterium]